MSVQSTDIRIAGPQERPRRRDRGHLIGIVGSLAIVGLMFLFWLMVVVEGGSTARVPPSSFDSGAGAALQGAPIETRTLPAPTLR